MDVKKLIEYGVIAVVAYFVVVWLLGTVEGIGASVSNAFAPPYSSSIFPQQVIWYGGYPPDTPVRWGNGGGGWGGGRPPRFHDGRSPGTGGY